MDPFREHFSDPRLATNEETLEPCCKEDELPCGLGGQAKVTQVLVLVGTKCPALCSTAKGG